MCNACTNKIIKISHDDPKVIIGIDKFEIIHSFCYLGDSISQSESWFEATTESEQPGRISSLLLVLTNNGILLKVRGWVYKACICQCLVVG